MALLLVDKSVVASCSSSPKPFSEGQRLFSSAATAVDCCCSVSGWRSRSDNRAGLVVAVMCGLQLQSKGNFSPSSSSPWHSDEFGWGFSRGSAVESSGKNGASRGRGRGRRGNRVVTMTLPIDAYWITAAQAIAVAGLMGGSAVVAGILINIRIEVAALKEFKELEEKGLLPDEFIIPDNDFDLEAPLYIFRSKEFLASNPPSRNRPVREEFEPQLETKSNTELETKTKPELEIANKE